MFFASTPDQTIFGEPDLADLLALVRDVCDAPEEVTVWHNNRVVCVVHDGQRITWIRPEYRAAANAA